MLGDKKKPGLAEVIVAEEKKKPDEDGSDEEEGSEDYAAAADEVFDALKADDKQAFQQAFKAAVMSCK